MALPAISAVGGLGSISSLAGVSSVSGSGGNAISGLSTSKSGGAVPGISFSDALSKVQGSIDKADELSRQLATGELTDIHEYTVAASKAQLGVQLTVALRNQLLGAFQEVMRMQL